MRRPAKKTAARDRLEWARARLLDAATETVCCLGDTKALAAALIAQSEANEDWQVAQLAMSPRPQLDPDDAARLEQMDAQRAREVWR
jgi:hypothetical protein